MKERRTENEHNFFSAFLTVVLLLAASVCFITVMSAAPIDDIPDSDLPSPNAVPQVTEAAVVTDKAIPDSGDDKLSGRVSRIVFPLAGRITSGFAYRPDPFFDPAGGGKPIPEFHRGIDISAAYSRDIMACADGEVIFVGGSTGYGNYLMIKHDGFVSLYAHCESVLCHTGESVDAGDSIAIAGSTGRSTGPHLHFEIRVNGESIDPLELVGCVYAGTAY